MKLEIGKKYTCKDQNVKYIRVDAICLDRSAPDCVVSVSLFHKDGRVESSTRNINGHYLSSHRSTRDLVSEYQGPTIALTAKDVGKKVKLRNGSVCMITSYCNINNLISLGGFSHPYELNGRYSLESSTDSNWDIVEILD